MTHTLTAMVLLAGVLSSSDDALAGNFRVAPVRISLDSQMRSTLVTVSNRGDTAVRLQLDVHRWDESPTGEVLLEPSGDVVVFPSLLVLAAGESRAVRVGTTAPVERLERSFRLIVEELPDQVQEDPGIALRMRMSVPIFVTDTGARAAPRLDAPTLATPRTLRVALGNEGERHFKPLALHVTLVDASGRTTHQRIPGWYVLPRHVREYSVALPPEIDCLREARVRLEHDGAALERVQAFDGRCVPSASR